ncbi:response regulator transcription factor [Fusibacter bizertensis]
MSNIKILVVDDEHRIRKLIRASLAKEGYHIDEAESGRVAMDLLSLNNYDLILLDIMLGDTDGFTLIRTIKEMKIATPIIVLSGRDDDHDKMLGLGLGANNYLTKPFSPVSLNAYVKAQIRDFKQVKSDKSPIIENGHFKFDQKTFQLYKDGQLIDLTSKENLLIKFLLENPHQVFSKQQLYENIWNNFIIDDGAIMVYIHNLRKKIEDDPKQPKHLLTVWGIGYKFVP